MKYLGNKIFQPTWSSQIKRMPQTSLCWALYEVFEIGLTDLLKNGEDYSGGPCVDEDYKGQVTPTFAF